MKTEATGRPAGSSCRNRVSVDAQVLLVLICAKPVPTEEAADDAYSRRQTMKCVSFMLPREVSLCYLGDLRRRYLLACPRCRLTLNNVQQPNRAVDENHPFPHILYELRVLRCPSALSCESQPATALRQHELHHAVMQSAIAITL